MVFSKATRSWNYNPSTLEHKDQPDIWHFLSIRISSEFHITFGYWTFIGAFMELQSNHIGVWVKIPNTWDSLRCQNNFCLFIEQILTFLSLEDRKYSTTGKPLGRGWDIFPLIRPRWIPRSRSPILCPFLISIIVFPPSIAWDWSSPNYMLFLSALNAVLG